jgi:hypothetical protein
VAGNVGFREAKKQQKPGYGEVIFESDFDVRGVFGAVCIDLGAVTVSARSDGQLV